LRILLASFGTRGDLQPVLALALGLRAAGHTVTLAGPPNFTTWIRSYGLRFEAVGSDVEKAANEVAFNIPLAIQAMRKEIHAHFETIAPLAREADAIVGAAIHCASVSLGEAYGIPAFYGFFSPQMLPSRHHAPAFVRNQHMPPWANKLTWSGLRLLWRLILSNTITEERHKLGLAPVAETWEHLLSSHPLFAGDPVLAPLPDDGPGGIFTTGPWLLPETEPLDAELEAFLQAGPPPVYIGFGSMPDARPEQTTRMLLDTVRNLGVRAVISSGWARLGLSDVPNSIRIVGPTSHSKLFPRCAAVVHHGGAGTTIAAANAGVPQLIVPHAFDQFHCARDLPLLGVAPPSIAKTRLTSARLEAALRICLDDQAMQAKAREVATRTIRDGVTRTVRHIEAVAAGEFKARRGSLHAV
jgi:UDP:flavonoid glycosyltransferase YjiC (YdhE family)